LWQDERLLASTTLDLPDDRSVPWSVVLPPSTRGAIQARLVPGDLFADDDVAWALVRPPRLRRVSCLGCSEPTLRALDSDPRFLRDEAVAPDLVVVEARPWPEAPSAPLLLLGGPPPEPGTPALWPRVTGWSSLHPALRAVDPTTWRVPRLGPAPRGWEVLVATDRGPLVVEGVLGGRRALALLTDPLQTDLPLRVAWPLFLLGAAEHLTAARDEGTGSLRAGAPATQTRPEPDGTEIVARPPGGPPRTAPVRGGLARFGSLDRLGIWTFRGPAGEEQVAVHLGSEVEGDLRMRPGDDGTAARGETTSLRGRPIQRELLALLTLVLLAEWWTWRRTEATA
jgi:hypothetical protein